MGPQAQIALKKLAESMAMKCDQPYAQVMGMLRCRLSFAIARAALVCLRGTRLPSRRAMTVMDDAPEVILEEVGFRTGRVR